GNTLHPGRPFANIESHFDRALSPLIARETQDGSSLSRNGFQESASLPASSKCPPTGAHLRDPLALPTQRSLTLLLLDSRFRDQLLPHYELLLHEGVEFFRRAGERFHAAL